MKTKSPFQDNRSGMTLVVVMVMTLLCTAAVSSVLYTVGARMQRAYKQIDMEKAFYIAEAGMERAAAWIADDNEDSETFEGDIGDGSYETVVTVTNLSGGEIGIEIVSTGTINGTSRTVTVRGLQRLSWARYALWYDREALDLSIAPGDKFRGRFYARPTLRFIKPNNASEGQAHFYDRAWSVSSTVEYNGAKPIFDYGLILNADRQEISEVKFSDLKAAAQTKGLVLEGDATIEMDGKTLKITNRPRDWDKHSYTIPENGIVYVAAGQYDVPDGFTTVQQGTKIEPVYKNIGTKKKPNWQWVDEVVPNYVEVPKFKTVTEPGDINVSGPKGLDGKLTIVAERDMNIIGHIRYADKPGPYDEKKPASTNPDSNDKLGLIAGRDAVVTKAAPNDVDIYAHIFCRDGGFGVNGYNSGSHRGKLNVYGGIANLIRNAVGQGNSGYWKNYMYDPRFAREPPPYYPRLTDVLAWDGWEG